MKKTNILAISVLALGLTVCLVPKVEAEPMGTAWTYQGRLMDANRPVDGLYDIAFVLFDAPEGPNEIYAAGVEDLDIIDGYFTVELDFGSRAFDGNRRWLEAAVRPYDSNDPNDFVALSPRTELTPAPYALYAKTAGGDNDWMLSGNDMYSLPSGNVGIGTSYPSMKLEVDGDINISIDSAYKIDGDTVLSIPSGKQSIFVGFGAGENTTGYGNAFLGTAAGYLNTTGYYNTFLGCGAGYLNTTGYQNTFVGLDAGESITEGSSNTFIGYGAGRLNTDGNGNVFVGNEAGFHERGSNKLYIANGRDDPNVLIYGDFSTGRVGIGTMSLGTAKLSVMGGNVGIGTTTPEYKLDVEGNIFVRGTEGFDAAGEDATVHLGHPAHNIRGEYGTGVVISAYSAADALTVREHSGNVGIGTINPQRKLHISGVLRLEPQSSPPSGALGDLYVGTNGKLYFHNGTQWKEVSLI